MTVEWMRQVLQMYCERLKDFPSDNACPDFHLYPSGAPYVHWMCKEVLSWDLKEDFEKANRWLGFIQGAFWVMGFYTINEMKEHNRAKL